MIGCSDTSRTLAATDVYCSDAVQSRKCPARNTPLTSTSPICFAPSRQHAATGVAKHPRRKQHRGHPHAQPDDRRRVVVRLLDENRGEGHRNGGCHQRPPRRGRAPARHRDAHLWRSRSRAFCSAVVSAEHLADTAVLDRPCPGRNGVDERPVVGHQHHRARVLHERRLEHLLRGNVEVIGRLVEQQEIGLLDRELAHHQTRPLAATQVADELERVVAAEKQ